MAVFACGLLWAVFVRCPLTIDLNDISFLTNGWILIRLDSNDPYMVPFNDCSNGSGLLHI